jgi:TPR repeat protein
VSVVRLAPSRRVQFIACASLLLLAAVAPLAFAGIDDGVKAVQAGDMPGAEKAFQVLASQHDPRAAFLLGFYVYGNPDSKMFDMSKAVPLLLDSAERGYTPAMIPLAGAYADGKGVPRSFTEAYKWLAIAERWNAPNADTMLGQIGHELKPDEIEQAKAAAAAYAFKTK